MSSLERQTFIARQALYTASLAVYGYELLHRRSRATSFDAADGDHATEQLIRDSLITIGLERLTEGRLAFVNAPREFLLSEDIARLPRAGLVIEVLEDAQSCPQVHDACRALGRAGFKLALDDFVLQPETAPLLELVNYVKVDVRATTPQQRLLIERAVRAVPGISPRLVAEKVESADEFEAAKAHGYTLFQGYFWGRPELVEGSALPASSVACMQLLAQLMAPAFDLHATLDVVRTDPALAQSLLRYVNSGLFRWVQRIESPQQALVTLGQAELRRWASISSVRSLHAEDRPRDLVVRAAARGRICELLAPSLGLAARSLDVFFLGLFSLLEELTSAPVADVLSHVPLPADVADALLGRPSALAALLRLSAACDRADFDALDALADTLGLEMGTVAESYLDAIGWAERLSGM